MFRLQILMIQKSVDLSHGQMLYTWALCKLWITWLICLPLMESTSVAHRDQHHHYRRRISALALSLALVCLRIELNAL